MSFTARNMFCFLMAVFLTDTVLAKSANGSSSSSGSALNTTVNAGTTTSSSIQSNQKEEVSMISGLFDISRSTSLYDFKDGSRKDGLDYEGRLNIKLTEKYSAHFIGGYSQDLKNAESDDFTDTVISVSNAKTKLGKILMVGYGVSTALPTSKDSYKNKGLLGTLGASLNLGITPDSLISGLGISGAIYLTRSFHEFETGMDGKVNTQYSSKQTLSLEYAFESGFSISGLFVHRNTWSYQNIMRDSFEAGEEIGYQFNPTIAVAVGHANSGASLKPNGTDSNVQLVDENESIAYLSTTLTF